MADESLSPESAPDPSAPIPIEESGSLADHEKLYSGEPQQTSSEAETKPVETPQAEDKDDSGIPADERDPKTGRFLPRRHRAASQEATPADVPRIQSLTARLRAVEAERDALKARTVTSAPAGTSAPSAPPSPPAAATPKPTPDKFDDYSAYVDALVDWRTEQALTAYQAKQQQVEQERARQSEQQRLASSWAERVTAAKAKYPDFENVALLTDTRIPQGSLIDAWILEHKAGAEVLYALQKDPAALDRLLNLPLFEQAESLALLSQRFNGNGSSRTAAVATGSVPALLSPSVPRPPNPVRTGPIKSGDDPPDPERSSLYDHEKYYWQRDARR